MKENEVGVLEQYEIEVKSTQRIRGAFLCDTKQGLFLLKELQSSQKRVPMLYQLCLHLKESGYERVDMIVKNKEEELVSTAEDGTKYILKQWFEGKECDIRREKDIIETTKNLARIHRILRSPIPWGEECKVAEGEDLRAEYGRHNRELKKVRSFIRGKVGKGEFELAFLKHFDGMYALAEQAGDRLCGSGYETLFQKSRERRTIVHGDYNYHNVLIGAGGIATTNFERFHIDTQMSDLYYFLRKTMEKHQWNESLGSRMLDAYSQVTPFQTGELEYLALALSYPEKFWKAADSYYRSRKAWIPAKSIEKLELAIRQTEEKKHFLETIFPFHL